MLTKTSRSRGGLRWILNPADCVHADIFWEGAKDRWDLYHVRRLLGPASVIYDVGANIGYYSLFLTHALGPKSRALAFEPFPSNYERLCQHVTMNSLQNQITPFCLGFSDQPREALMSMRANNSGSANLNASGSADCRQVNLTTLDSFWQETQTKHIDFIKIDVEGHEAPLLRGGADVLQREQPLVLIELDAPRLTEGGSSVEEVVGILEGYGYQLFRARRSRLVPLAEPPTSVINVFGSTNTNLATVT